MWLGKRKQAQEKLAEATAEAKALAESMKAATEADKANVKAESDAAESRKKEAGARISVPSRISSSFVR